MGELIILPKKIIMFAQFLDIVFKSLKLDRSLYRDSKYFGEAAIYFAGLIMMAWPAL